MFKQKNIRLICFMSIFIMALSYMLVACDNQNKNCNHAGTESRKNAHSIISDK